MSLQWPTRQINHLCQPYWRACMDIVCHGTTSKFTWFWRTSTPWQSAGRWRTLWMHVATMWRIIIRSSVCRMWSAHSQMMKLYMTIWLIFFALRQNIVNIWSLQQGMVIPKMILPKDTLVFNHTYAHVSSKKSPILLPLPFLSVTNGLNKAGGTQNVNEERRTWDQSFLFPLSRSARVCIFVGALIDCRWKQGRNNSQNWVRLLILKWDPKTAIRASAGTIFNRENKRPVKPKSLHCWWLQQCWWLRELFLLESLEIVEPPWTVLDRDIWSWIFANSSYNPALITHCRHHLPLPLPLPRPLSDVAPTTGPYK